VGLKRSNIFGSSVEQYENWTVKDSVKRHLPERKNPFLQDVSDSAIPNFAARFHLLSAR